MLICMAAWFLQLCKLFSGRFIIMDANSNSSGFENEIITAVAGIGRCAGGVAHWKEAASKNLNPMKSLLGHSDTITDKDPKIWRPTQLYTGPMTAGQDDVD